VKINNPGRSESLALARPCHSPEHGNLSAADPTEKLEALAAMTPPTLKRGRFRAPDKLLAMLKDTRALKIMWSEVGRKP